MEYIKKRYDIVIQTLYRLQEGMQKLENADQDSYESYRKSLIQRFEYTIDTFWKFIKLYMQDYQEMVIDLASPRGILRMAVEAKIITEDELNRLFIALSDKNISSHTYNQILAEEIAQRIPNHYTLIHAIVGRLQAQ